MGKSIYKKFKFFFLSLLLGGVINIFAGNPAYSVTDPGTSGSPTTSSTGMTGGTCVINGGSLFPSNPSWISQFGDNRGDGSRKHTGIDMGYAAGQIVPQPPGCEILLNSEKGYRFDNKNQPVDNASGSIIGGDNGGYGIQLFYKCAKPDGDQVTLRYSHVPLEPLTNSKQIIQGATGNASGGPPHYHFEIVIGDRPVDPECVMYGDKPHFGLKNLDNPSNGCEQKCPAGIGPGPVNLCDKSIRDILIKHGQDCSRTSKYPSGQTRTVPGGESIDPNRLGPTDGTIETGGPTTTDPYHDGDSNEPMGEGAIDGGFFGDPAEIEEAYPSQLPEPEPVPPPPPIPGIPGGAPNLTPPPGPGDPVPDKVSGCAADTWTAMVNQAVMETRREDLLNKRFIVKPDSVLDYSCFAAEVQHASDNIAPLFSETQRWNDFDVDLIGKTVTIKLLDLDDDNDPLFSEKGYNLSRDYVQSNGTSINYAYFDSMYHDGYRFSVSLDMAIDAAVGKAMVPYIEDNFNYGFLADTVSVPTPSSSTCDTMQKVWNAAKCKNFDSTDVFYSFEDLTTKDPREFPANMPCL